MTRAQQRIRFELFEVDPRAGELRRAGEKVELQDQPFQALVLLLERPGEVVTREELCQRLWPEGTYVDFDRGLNKAINKLRAALRDNAEKPRFVETLPQRGYRFVAPVETFEPQETPSALETAQAPPFPAPSENVIPSGSRPAKREVVAWTVAGLAILFAAAVFQARETGKESIANKPLLHFDLDVGPDEFSQLAISADGMQVVTASKGALELRRLDQTKAVRLAGTEWGVLPFFSPDGKWIGFFADGKLQKVAIGGGTPIALCRAESAGGGTWADNDHIIAALGGSAGLYRVPAAGGLPQPLTHPKSDPSGPLMHLWPQALPGGKAVLFAAVNGSQHGSLRIETLDDGKVRTVVDNATRGVYLASGYLVFYSNSRLYSVPVDRKNWRTTGPAVPLVSGVSSSFGSIRGEFDISQSGTLVYRGGTDGSNFVVSWLSPSGKIEPVLKKPDSFFTPRLSPDGNRLAVAMIEENRQSLWIYDFKRETWAKLTSDAAAELLPTWSPDGEFVAFRSADSLAWTRSDGSGAVRRLAGANANVAPWSFSSDGKWLAFWPLQPGSDLWMVPVQRAPGTMQLGAPKRLLEGSGSKGAPAISPDGRWVAYASSESGYFEIYVIPFSPEAKDTPHKWLISGEGGTAPIWSRNGRELLYQGRDRHVWVAPYRIRGGLFVAEKPRFWSPTLLGETGIFAAFDLAPDGKRVIALLAAEDPKDKTLMRVMLNVDSELRRIAGSAK